MTGGAGGVTGGAVVTGGVGGVDGRPEHGEVRRLLAAGGVALLFREREEALDDVGPLGELGAEALDGHAAADAGLLGLARSLAKELGPAGIRVNTVAPGIMLTPMMSGMPQEVQDSLAAQVPFPKRLGKPEEYADTIAFIYETTYVNSETIRCDGAIRMQPK